MSATTEKLRGELAGLSDSDRAELARFLLCSLDTGADQDAEVAWDAELARRAEEIRSGQAGGEPAEKVIAGLRAKYS